MEPEIIHAPEGAKYVGEFMTQLPIGILDKGITGCGATTLALENDRPAIICCPTVNLIKNKVSQYPREGRCQYNPFGVYKGVKQATIRDYISHSQHPPKILVTYNSTPRVMEILGEQASNYQLVVDECQEMLLSYSYRDEAIVNLFRSLRGKDVSYITATPIPAEFLSPEMVNLPKYSIQWNNLTMPRVVRIETNKPHECIMDIIRSFLREGKWTHSNGLESRELIIFLNSTTKIKSLIQEFKLTNEQVKLICADNPENRRFFSNTGICISDATGPPKPLTFCTKTAFNGCDFYSQTGVCIVVSYSKIPCTQLDIRTDIRQICGRIRNDDNPSKDILYHIMDISEETQTREDFDREIRRLEALADEWSRVYDGGSPELKEAIKLMVMKPIAGEGELARFDPESNRLICDITKIRYLQYKYKYIDEVYGSSLRMRDAYAEAGFDVSQQPIYKQIEWNSRVRCSKPTFRDLYEEYSSERANRGSFGVSDRAREIAEAEPLIPQAFQYLSLEDLDSVDYDPDDVKKLVCRRLPSTKDAYKNLINRHVRVDGRYSNRFLKNVIQSAYDTLRIEKTAKATDIQKLFDTEYAKVRDERGKRVDGYSIKGPKDPEQAYLFFILSWRR